MLTVHGLRKLGYKVSVHHNRFVSKEFGGKKRGERDLVGANMYEDLTPKMFDPCGGETIVSVAIPRKNGIVVLSTRAKCRKDENYNRKEGVRLALERIEALAVDEMKDVKLAPDKLKIVVQ